MNIFYRPIFVIFVVFVALGLALQMSRGVSGNYRTRLEAAEQKNAQLQLAAAETKLRYETATLPNTQARLYLDTYKKVLPNETALQMPGFTFEPRVLPSRNDEISSTRDAWWALIMP